MPRTSLETQDSAGVYLHCTPALPAAPLHYLPPTLTTAPASHWTSLFLPTTPAYHLQSLSRGTTGLRLHHYLPACFTSQFCLLRRTTSCLTTCSGYLGHFSALWDKWDHLPPAWDTCLPQEDWDLGKDLQDTNLLLHWDCTTHRHTDHTRFGTTHLPPAMHRTHHLLLLCTDAVLHCYLPGWDYHHCCTLPPLLPGMPTPSIFSTALDHFTPVPKWEESSFWTQGPHLGLCLDCLCAACLC